jgi:hypothetical protein
MLANFVHGDLSNLGRTRDEEAFLTLKTTK